MFCRNPKFTLSPQRCLSVRHTEYFHYLLPSHLGKPTMSVFKEHDTAILIHFLHLLMAKLRNGNDFCDDAWML